MILFQSWVIIEYMDFSSKTTAMNNGIKERPFDFYGGAIKIFRKKNPGPNFPEKLFRAQIKRHDRVADENNLQARKHLPPNGGRFLIREARWHRGIASNPEREVGVRSSLASPCCILEQDTFASQKVLVIPRQRWLRPDMTEKLLTWTESLNTPPPPKKKIKNKASLCLRKV